ncbi:MAG: hypothetical protein HUJ72_05635 [Blautia sp.]|nr:hypothetical protein [Blautia sp.]
MLSLNILDLKDFTGRLFVGTDFDSFLLTEATITTFNTFSIDGRLKAEYFDSSEIEELHNEHQIYAKWQVLRPHCLSLIRGKRLPVSFKIILSVSPDQASSMIADANIPAPAEFFNGFFLNIQYKNRILTCTTGISYRAFLTDRRPEQLWDDSILHFFRKSGISFEEQ